MTAEAVAEAPAAPTVNLDEFGKQAVEQANTLIAQRNEKVGLLLAAQGDPQGLLEALRNSSENPQVVKLREQIDKLNDQLLAAETKRDELLKPEVDAMRADAESKQESVTKEVDEIDAKVKSARNFIKQMYGENALTLLTDMVARKNRASSDGEGSGKRIRGFDIYVDNTLAVQRDGKGVERSNFAAAAKLAEVDTVTLQQGFWDAQGTQDSKKFKERVEFTVVAQGKGEDGEDVSHTIVAVKTPEHKEANEAEAATGDPNAEVPA